MERDSHDGTLLQSTPQCHRSARHSSAARVHLPPEAVREVRKLQNFFPLPLWKKEEEALAQDDEPEDEGCLKDLPESAENGILQPAADKSNGKTELFGGFPSGLFSSHGLSDSPVV